MKHKLKTAFAAGALLLGATAALAAGDHAQHSGAAPASASVPAGMTMTTGEVRKVDAEQSKVTIKHEAITNLQMPSMTMVFRANKPEMLRDLKAGDKISFAAESVGGAVVVTHIQPVK